MGTNRVIVVIISHKPVLTDVERISLRQCVAILGHHPITFVCPDGLDTSWYRTFVPEVPFHFVDRRWLESYAMFNTFKISPYLYDKYRDYEYILFYEPDSFVFSDELIFWCNQGLDYIGAPWFDGLAQPKSQTIIGAGNGGFSLRKVSTHLRIARLFQRRRVLFQGYRRHKLDKLRYVWSVGLHLAGLTSSRPCYISCAYAGHEDLFWCQQVPRSHPEFKLATPEQALSFSFETQPRLLFEMNGRRLPFGCHAWFKYDLAFWGPFIQQFGFQIDEDALSDRAHRA